MALIKCPECANQVSNTAAACPKCGAPIAESGVKVGTPLTTTQSTSKRLKGQVVISGLLFWVGVVWLICAANLDAGGGSFFGSGLCLTVGTIWYLVTKARVWWHHG